MVGSQALETAIGLAVMFFVIATTASSIVEIISRLVSMRGVHLERALKTMIAGAEPASGTAANLRRALPKKIRTSIEPQAAPEDPAFYTAFTSTSIFTSVTRAAGQTLFRGKAKKPSHLSATAFADAVTEALMDEQGVVKLVSTLPEPLQKRLTALLQQSRGDLLAVKSGLERWFDETMDHVAGAYKRWATVVLFAVGLIIAIGGNVSTVTVAQQLWVDPVVRQTVVASADQVTAPGAKLDLRSVADATTQLQALQLPVGYQSCSDAIADSEAGCPAFAWNDLGPTWAATFAGWLLTAVLAMLGGPFWFDLLGKLVSLRSSGARPAAAADDPSSATSARGSATAAPGTASDLASVLRAQELAQPAAPQEMSADVLLTRAMGASAAKTAAATPGKTP